MWLQNLLSEKYVFACQDNIPSIHIIINEILSFGRQEGRCSRICELADYASSRNVRSGFAFLWKTF